MITEMRRCKTNPGYHPEFRDVFRSKSTPTRGEIGMKILSTYAASTGVQDSSPLRLADSSSTVVGTPGLAAHV